MKNSIVFFVLLSIATACTCPRNYLNKSLTSQAKGINQIHIDVPRNQVFTVEFLDKQIKKHKFTLVSCELEQRSRFGIGNDYVNKFSFIPTDPLSLARALEQKRIRDDEIDKQFQIFAGALIGLYAKGTYKLGKDYLEYALAQPSTTKVETRNQDIVSDSKASEEETDEVTSWAPKEIPKCEKSTPYPNVKETGEWIGSNRTIKFNDGTIGTLFQSGDEYKISDGFRCAWYRKYEDAVRALYYYKKFQYFSPVGRRSAF